MEDLAREVACVESLIVLGGLGFILVVLLRTWKRGHRKQNETARRMQQDVRRFHDDLHLEPKRGRPGRYRGPGQGWR